jgi:hypothetical protein
MEWRGDYTVKMIPATLPEYDQEGTGKEVR